MPLTRQLARRYSKGDDLEDLEQVAALGLVKAIDRFDPSRGLAFSRSPSRRSPERSSATSAITPGPSGFRARYRRPTSAWIARPKTSRHSSGARPRRRSSPRPSAARSRRCWRPGKPSPPGGPSRSINRRAATTSPNARRRRRHRRTGFRDRRAVRAPRHTACAISPTATASSCSCASSATSRGARSANSRAVSDSGLAHHPRLYRQLQEPPTAEQGHGGAIPV